MKVKELIDLLKTIDNNADIIAPIDNDGFADQFVIDQVTVVKDAQGKGSNKPPYTEASESEQGAEVKYILDCVWSKVFDFKERNKEK